MFMKEALFVSLIGSVAFAGGVNLYTNDAAGYTAATGGITDLFVDFETDSGGAAIIIGGQTQIDGGTFSNQVTYMSNGGSDVNIADIDLGIDNEIGPATDWDGVLRWEYGTTYSATSFTGVDVGSPSVISFFLNGSLVDSVAVGGNGGTFQFFGFVVASGFDAVEMSGAFYAIDAHASTLPSPSAAIVLAMGGLLGTRRRR